MKFKKILSVITLISLVFAMCVPAFAARHTVDDFETETIGDFIYEKDTNVILGYTGDAETVEMPTDCVIAAQRSITNSAPNVKKVILASGKMRGTSLTILFPNIKEVEYKEGVTEIGDSAFSFLDYDENNKTIERFIFPSTLKKIGRWAFSSCRGIKTVELPEGLEELALGAFSGCASLSGDITIPDTVTSMGRDVFAGCGDLDKVHISENAVYKKDDKYLSSTDYTANWFGDYLVDEKTKYTNVKEINIPKTIMRDKNCKFYADEIIFDGDFTLDMIDMVSQSKWYNEKYLENKTDKNSVSDKDFVILDGTLLKYIGSDKSPVIPEGVKSIRASAFYFVDLDTVVFPKSLERIESYAFSETTLKQIRIPANVKTIEEYAFINCPLIEKIVFEKIPKNIGAEGVFNDCVKLNYLDYRDNIICEDENAVIPENLYSGALLYNIEPMINTINRKRGTNIKFDNYLIIAPSNDSWVNDPEMKAEMEKQGLLPTASPSAQPSESAKPEASAKPEESAKPQPSGEPVETPEAKTLEVNGNDMSIKIDNNMVNFPDVKPFIDDNNRTQIPVRAVAEMLDCIVDWNDDSKTAVITNKNGDIVRLTIDSDVMTMNDKPVQMDTAAMIKDNRTYIPIRFAAEAMGLTVEWVK